MPRPRERVYTLDKQKKHLARLSLLSAKRFRFNIAAHRPSARQGTRYVWGGWLGVLFTVLCSCSAIPEGSILQGAHQRGRMQYVDCPIGPVSATGARTRWSATRRMP